MPAQNNSSHSEALPTWLSFEQLAAACMPTASAASAQSQLAHFLTHIGFSSSSTKPTPTPSAFDHVFARTEEDIFSTPLWHKDVRILFQALSGNPQLREPSFTSDVSLAQNAPHADTPQKQKTSASSLSTASASQNAGGSVRPGYQYVIATDGSCLHNPGPGGWAWLREGTDEYEAGGHAHTTNNIMELTAIIKALEYVPEDASLLLRSDSQYSINILTKWAEGWKRRGWKKADGSPVLNRPLVQRMYELYTLRPGPVDIEWVHGHNGDPANEECDRLAREQAKKFTK